MYNEFRFAARLLRRSPGFTIVVVSTLALGIGLSAALFSVVYTIFFRPPDVSAPHRLAYLYWTPGRLQNPKPSVMTRADYEFLRDHPEAFEAMTAHAQRPAVVSVNDVTETVNGELVEANYFEVLGVRPAFGRTFGPIDESAAATDVAVVISFDFWRRHFHHDAEVLGKTMRIGHEQSGAREAIIIGVMPEGFVGISDPWTASHYWTTFAHGGGLDFRRTAVAPIARLKAGVDLRQAQAIVTAQGAQLNATRPGREKDRYWVLPAGAVRMPYDPAASVAPARLATSMIVVVAIVLLVTTVNIASMMWGRSVGRSTEIFVRRALGASGLRITLQLLIESVVLAAIAGFAGLIVAGWLLAGFRVYAPETFAVRVRLEPVAWTFASLLALGIGILINVGPAFRCARTQLVAQPPASGRTRGPLARSVLRNSVILPQIALAMLLLVVAVAHVRALAGMERRDLGYDPHGVTTLTISIQSARDGRADLSTEEMEKQALRSRDFYRSLSMRIQDTPGAATVAVANRLPVRTSGGSRQQVVVSQEAVLAGDAKGPGAEVFTVSPGYFDALRMSFVAGRRFDDRDSASNVKVAIISETLAKLAWPGDQPIGKALAILGPGETPTSRTAWLEVIGIVKDVKPILQDQDAIPLVYVPLSQQWRPAATYLIARIEGNPLSTIHYLKAAVSSSDPRADVSRIQAMDRAIAELLYPRRLAATIVATAAAIALSLAVVGLYGVMSHSVANRVQEIGVRAALGADRVAIVRFIVREAVVVSALAGVLGVVLSYVAVRISERLFTGMPSLDLLTLAVVPIALTAVVVIAGYVPARRAAGISPIEALRAL